MEARIVLEYAKQEAILECLGTIEDIEESDDNEFLLIINIDEMDEETYEKFMELYQKRQTNIVGFMDMAKGVA